MFSKLVAFLLEFSAILFSTILAIMLEIKLFRWCFLLYNYLLSELELEIHQDFVCLLILLLVFVLWILGRTLWHFHYKKNPDISRVPIMESVWTLSLFLSFSFFFSELLLETVDCAGKDSGGGASTSSPKPDMELGKISCDSVNKIEMPPLLESFFALPFCSYGSWVGIRVMVRKSFQDRTTYSLFGGES